MRRVLKEKQKFSSLQDLSKQRVYSYTPIPFTSLRQKIMKNEYSRSKSQEIEQDSLCFTAEQHLDSTYQTSLNISLDDALNSQHELAGKLQIASKKISLEAKNEFKFKRSSENRIGSLKEPKKTLNFTKIQSKITSVPIRESKNHSLQVKKAEMNGRSSLKSINHNATLGKIKSTGSRSGRLKAFAPVLSTKLSKRSHADKILQKIVKNVEICKKSKGFIDKLERVAETEVKLKEKSDAQSIPMIPSDSPASKLPIPSEIYFSPLKNVKKFVNLNKVQENPYSSADISLARTLEDLHQALLLSDPSESSSKESLKGLNSIESSSSELQPDFNKSQVRELSFGFGGGDFIYQEIHSDEPKVYYQPEKILPEPASSFQNNKERNVNELLLMVSDQEFLKSLKIIGKFAKFIENKL